jgi:hypothetical protein
MATKRFQKILLSLVVVGLVSGALVFGVFSAFSATTSNPDNAFGAGSVAISDNDSGTALYSVTNREPGDAVSKCIRVTYTGSLQSSVRFYRSTFTAGTGLDPYVQLKVERADSGTVTDYATCAGFDATPTTEYDDTLANLGTGYAGGVTLEDSGGSANWDQNDAVDYKVTATLLDNNSGNGLITGTHSFTWEARNN